MAIRSLSICYLSVFDTRFAAYALLVRVASHTYDMILPYIGYDPIVTENLAPGIYVRHPAKPDWGIGQIQSVIGHRITVNFEHAGKLLINGASVNLEIVGDNER